MSTAGDIQMKTGKSSPVSLVGHPGSAAGTDLSRPIPDNFTPQYRQAVLRSEPPPRAVPSDASGPYSTNHMQVIISCTATG